MNVEQINAIQEILYKELDKDVGLIDFMLDRFINRDDGYKNEIGQKVYLRIANYFQNNKKFTAKYVYPYIEANDKENNISLIAAELTDIIMTLTIQYVDDRLKDHMEKYLFIN